MKTIIAAALATGFVMGGGMIAQAQGSGDGHGNHFAKIDTNGDGTLSQSELAAAQAARFAEIDTNQDGYLSTDEIRTHHEAKRGARRAQRQERMMKRIDTDGNGLISRAEFEARPKRGLMRADTNGDGAITPDEIEAMKAKRREHRRKRLKQQGGSGPQ